jgi:NADH:flavin oxidoreductase / NADH oxidase family
MKQVTSRDTSPPLSTSHMGHVFTDIPRAHPFLLHNRSWTRSTKMDHLYSSNSGCSGAPHTRDVLQEEGGHPLLTPSPIPLDNTSPSSTPRSLTVEEIQEYVQLFATAAQNTILGAGFDGVGIHAVNGYLPDQFCRQTPISAQIRMATRWRITHASCSRLLRQSSMPSVKTRWAYVSARGLHSKASVIEDARSSHSTND